MPDIPRDHPFVQWLDTYRDPYFVTSTREVLQIVERAFEEASPTERAQAVDAYLVACRHELEFFDQALRLPEAIDL